MQHAMKKYTHKIKRTFGGQGTNVSIILNSKEIVGEEVIWLNLVQVTGLWARSEYVTRLEVPSMTGYWIRHYYYLIKNENIYSVMHKRWS
jgi:hypothetical protein